MTLRLVEPDHLGDAEEALITANNALQAEVALRLAKDKDLEPEQLAAVESARHDVLAVLKRVRVQREQKRLDAERAAQKRERER